MNFPSSGGEYVYLTEAFGPTWGFMTGWISFFAGFSAPIAAAALAFSDYLGHFFNRPEIGQRPARHRIGRLGAEARRGAALASAIIALFTVINCLGIRRTARVQNVLTSLKIVIILTFLITGFAFGQGSWENFTHPAVRTSVTPMFAQFFVSLFYIYVAYSGWNAATYVAEELKHPARTLPLVAHLRDRAGGGAIYRAQRIVHLRGAAGIDEGRGGGGRTCGPASLWTRSGGHLQRGDGAFAAGDRERRGHHWPARLLRDGQERRVLQHGRESGSALAHARHRDLCQGVCSVLMTVSPFLNLLLYIGLLLNFFAVLSVGSLFVFRRRPGWQKLGVVSFAYPLLPAFFVAVGIWMTILGVMLRPAISAVAVLTVAAGAVVYHFRLRKATA